MKGTFGGRLRPTIAALSLTAPLCAAMPSANAAEAPAAHAGVLPVTADPDVTTHPGSLVVPTAPASVTDMAAPSDGAPGGGGDPAQPPGPRPAGEVVFSYDAPQIAEDGSHVTWHWTVQNKSAGTASQVTLVHRLNPPLSAVRASAPCEVSAKMIRCHWDTIQPGATREGAINAELPPDLSGTVQISGRITWQQGASGKLTDSSQPPGRTTIPIDLPSGPVAPDQAPKSEQAH